MTLKWSFPKINVPEGSWRLRVWTFHWEHPSWHLNGVQRIPSLTQWRTITPVVTVPCFSGPFPQSPKTQGQGQLFEERAD